MIFSLDLLGEYLSKCLPGVGQKFHLFWTWFGLDLGRFSEFPQRTGFRRRVFVHTGLSGATHRTLRCVTLSPRCSGISLCPERLLLHTGLSGEPHRTVRCVQRRCGSPLATLCPVRLTLSPDCPTLSTELSGVFCFSRQQISPLRNFVHIELSGAVHRTVRCVLRGLGVLCFQPFYRVFFWGFLSRLLLCV